ncbi:MAG: diacylglycerol O-acyltransferase / wax synthase [Solirubrobacteraceae bacterium]|jgi:WS/DGAT/MGAT family acyltransferase|nr:diacylglycerol O-acyltransferase / wax synthase [Solirubrobacteraceae bacterium]
MQRISPVDAAWLAIESRDTPMHVGGLFEFTLPDDAPQGYLGRLFEQMREVRAIPPPWNLKLLDVPLIGSRLPVMRQSHDVDLDYHVRHSALPHPGGQRELGVLVSRLHSNELDLHRPLWEVHLIEGLEGNRFAMYTKIHHSLVDGVSGMRLIIRTLSGDPAQSVTPAFWTVGGGERPKAEEHSAGSGPLALPLGLLREGAATAGGLSRAALDLALAAVDDRSLQAPYRAPASALGGRLGGQRRFATQQYELARVKRIAAAFGCTLNDLVLYLSGTALRHYLAEHAHLPERSLTAGIPVNLRHASDQSMGTAIGIMVAELGTNVANPIERLHTISRSTDEAKRHLSHLPPEARTSYTLLVNAPYIASLMLGLGGHAPVPFNVAISNVPGPTEPLYMNGSRLDSLFPLSLLTHGNALNITCVSYAGTLNFGFTGARDTMPHLQRLAIYMGEALDEVELAVLGKRARAGARAMKRTKPARAAR